MNETSAYAKLWGKRADSSQGNGWVSPAGEAHFCSYAEHAAYAEIVFGKSDLDLLREGWVKFARRLFIDLSLHITYALDKNDADVRMTQAQARTLRKLGVAVNEDDVMAMG